MICQIGLKNDWWQFCNLRRLKPWLCRAGLYAVSRNELTSSELVTSCVPNCKLFEFSTHPVHTARRVSSQQNSSFCVRPYDYLRSHVRMIWLTYTVYTECRVQTIQVHTSIDRAAVCECVCHFLPMFGGHNHLISRFPVDMQTATADLLGLNDTKSHVFSTLSCQFSFSHAQNSTKIRNMLCTYRATTSLLMR